MKLSGWNCNPKIGSDSWEIDIMFPCSSKEVAISEEGSEDGSTTQEW